MSICLSILLTGCQIGTDDHQVTTLDEKYTVSKESPEEDSADVDEKEVLKKEETEGSVRSDGKKAEEEETASEVSKTKKNAAQKKERSNEAGQESDKDSSDKRQTKEEKSAEKTKEQDTAKRRTSRQTKEPDKKASQTKEEAKSDRAKKEQESHKKDTGKKSEGTAKKNTAGKCTLSIECSTILDNMDQLKESKKSFVPKDGVILDQVSAAIEDGDSVYDILYRVCRERKIHFESKYTPAYSTYYVEGIHQLYEFDCGSLSGWVYLVNGQKPNYGCSSYKVKAGDQIRWSYTCNAGKDIDG